MPFIKATPPGTLAWCHLVECYCILWRSFSVVHNKFYHYGDKKVCSVFPVAPTPLKPNDIALVYIIFLSYPVRWRGAVLMEQTELLLYSYSEIHRLWAVRKEIIVEESIANVLCNSEVGHEEILRRKENDKRKTVFF